MEDLNFDQFIPKTTGWKTETAPSSAPAWVPADLNFDHLIPAAPLSSYQALSPKESAALNWMVGGTSTQPIPAQIAPFGSAVSEETAPNFASPKDFAKGLFGEAVKAVNNADLRPTLGNAATWLQNRDNNNVGVGGVTAMLDPFSALSGGSVSLGSLTDAARHMYASRFGTRDVPADYDFNKAQAAEQNALRRFQEEYPYTSHAISAGMEAGMNAPYGVHGSPSLGAEGPTRAVPTSEITSFVDKMRETSPRVPDTLPAPEIPVEAKPAEAAPAVSPAPSNPPSPADVANPFLYDWNNPRPITHDIVGQGPRHDIDYSRPEMYGIPKAPETPVAPDIFDLLAPNPKEASLAPQSAPPASEAPLPAPTTQEAVKPASEPVQAIGKPPQIGQPQQIVTPDGSMRVEGVPQIVELSDLKYAGGELQPRDRSRKESQAGVNDRAANLDPSRLQPAPVSDSGAPIVSPDGTILSGNGRTMSIEKVYRDPRYMSSAGDYRASLGPAADGFKEPVLVMRLPDMPMEQQRRFADLSNRPSIADMSATERALRDVNALGVDAFGEYQGGDVTALHNNAFFKNFMRNAVTEAERGALSKDGALTKEGHDRLNAALMAAAYKDPGTLSLMLESTEDNVRAITNAMKENAGRFAKLRAGIDTGVVNPAMDAAPSLTEAVKLISRLRSDGVKLINFLAQQDALNPLNPAVERWVRAFYNDDLSRAVSQQRIAEVLKTYADEAIKHHQGGFIEDPTTASNVIDLAIAKRRAEEQQGDLLSRRTPGVVSAESRTETPRPEPVVGGGLEAETAPEPKQPAAATEPDQYPLLTREEAARSYPVSLGEGVKPPLEGVRGKYPNLADVPVEEKGRKPAEYDFLHHAIQNQIPVQFDFGGKTRIGTPQRLGLVSESPGSGVRLHLYQTGGEISEGKNGSRQLKPGEGRWGHFNLEPTGVIPGEQGKRGATVDPSKQITNLGYAPLGTPFTIPKNAHNIQSGIKSIHVQIPYGEDAVHGGNMFAPGGNPLLDAIMGGR